MAHAKIYRCWLSMRGRCLNPRNKNFRHYGGRGIDICARWRNSFEAYYADVGDRPAPRMSLDRRDNDRGYHCGKCSECIERGREPNWRWATQAEQVRNSRATTEVTVDGVTRSIGEWAARIGITQQSMGYRLAVGWPPELAVSTPADPRAVVRGQKSAAARIARAA